MPRQDQFPTRRRQGWNQATQATQATNQRQPKMDTGGMGGGGGFPTAPIKPTRPFEPVGGLDTKPLDTKPPGGSAPFNPMPGGNMNTQPQTPGMSPVPSFNQRRLNAQALYGPGGAGWQQNFGGAPGVGSMQPMGPPPVAPMGPTLGPQQFGPPQQTDPPVFDDGQRAVLQQLFSQPGFMQLLQQYMNRGVVKPQTGGTGPFNLPPQQY